MMSTCRKSAEGKLDSRLYYTHDIKEHLFDTWKTQDLFIADLFRTKF
jgi:hypothetical protein